MALRLSRWCVVARRDSDGVMFLSSRGRHTRSLCDWSSDVCSSDLEQARHYRGVLTGDAKAVAAADAWLRENEPRHASMLRTSVSPNIIQGGYRQNVIPSEAKVTLDVRMLDRK